MYSVKHAVASSVWIEITDKVLLTQGFMYSQLEQFFSTFYFPETEMAVLRIYFLPCLPASQQTA